MLIMSWDHADEKVWRKAEQCVKGSCNVLYCWSVLCC